MSDKEELDKTKKSLEEIVAAVGDAMGDSSLGGRALMSLRWIRKIAERGLGKSDD